MIRLRYSNASRCYVRLGKNKHQVSVRLPEKIYDIIDSYDGCNFTDKLINYIFDHEYGNLDQKM